jgi:hypothetical protein
MHELVAFAASCFSGAGAVSMNAKVALVHREEHFNTESLFASSPSPFTLRHMLPFRVLDLEN